MIGFFQEDENSKSMSRLCMLIGVCGGVVAGIALVIILAFTKIQPKDWICFVPLSLMVGGCLPYIFNKAYNFTQKVLESPALQDKIESIVKAARNGK